MIQRSIEEDSDRRSNTSNSTTSLEVQIWNENELQEENKEMMYLL